MKHCWHPTGQSVSVLGGGADALVCCWCGASGKQSFDTERMLTSGHGQHWVRLVKVKRAVRGKPEECTAPRTNQLKDDRP